MAIRNAPFPTPRKLLVPQNKFMTEQLLCGDMVDSVTRCVKGRTLWQDQDKITYEPLEELHSVSEALLDRPQIEL